MRVLLVVILSHCIGLSCGAALSEREGGGGSLLAAEFASVGKRAIRLIAKGDPSLDFGRIETQLSRVEIAAVGAICFEVEGFEYCEDAHYFAGKELVLFDKNAWKSMSCRNAMVLSSHEFFRAVGLEAGNYRYSERILSGRLAACDFNSEDCLVKNDYLMVALQNFCESFERQRIN